MEILVFEGVDSATLIRTELSAAGHEVRVVARDATRMWGELIVLDASAWSADEVRALARRMPDAELLFLVDAIDDVLPIEDGMALVRPVDVAKLVRLVRMLSDARSGREDPRELVTYETLFTGDSPAIVDLLRQVRLVAQSDHPVAIYGELGTGRVVTARAIHDRGMRQGGAFVSVNAAVFPGAQLEDHLFGGATPLVARAVRGTLFVDSVSSTSDDVLAKLVRLVDARDVRVMVGDERGVLSSSQPSRARFASRLTTHELDVPALRDRATDLVPIIARMLARLDDGRGASLSTAAARALDAYSFPGNLRELAQALTHAALLADGRPIAIAHLPFDIQDLAEAETETEPELLDSLEAVARRFERTYLLRVLRAVGGNRTRAAKILDLSRKGLWQKLKAHGIAADEGRDVGENEVEID